MRARPIVAVVTLCATSAASMAIIAGRADAVVHVWDPTIAATAEPILDRADGDPIPFDDTGLGGTMIDRLPTDMRTPIERRIEADIAAALNLERTSRGLPALLLSDHLSAIDHRFVEQLVSDVDDYPNCPLFGTTPSCDAVSPTFSWYQFLNPSNGAATFTHLAGGAEQGANNIRPGSYLIGLMNSGGHRVSVLSFQATQMGVGVKCMPDGMTYMVWDAGSADPAVINASPTTWQGVDTRPVNSADFGARCPQPGPTFTTSSTSGALTVTPTSVVQVAPCRAVIDGPLLVGPSTIHATLTLDGVLVAEASWDPYTPTGYAHHTFAELADGVYTVVVEGSNACETTQTRSARQKVTGAAGPRPNGSRFHATIPVRNVDTRVGQGGRRLVAGQPASLPLAAIDRDATAVTVNLTVVDAAGPGYATAYECGTSVPATSSVNYNGGAPAPNQVTVAVSGAALCIVSSQDADVIVDVHGQWLPAPGGTEFVAEPWRLWDTRAQGGVIGGVLVVPLGTPPPTATAVSVNITADRINAAGFVTAWDCATARPLVSNLNPAATTVANHATVAVHMTDTRAGLCLYASQPMELVVDLTGWWTLGTGTKMLGATAPRRALDTRVAGTALQPGVPRHVLPARAGDYVLNVTVADETAPGWLAVFPCTGGYTGTSTVNYVTHVAASNAAIVDGSSGVCAISLVATHLIVDAFGVIE